MKGQPFAVSCRLLFLIILHCIEGAYIVANVNKSVVNLKMSKAALFLVCLFWRKCILTLYFLY